MADVIIIGGGPAGSVLGSYLSMAGVSNIILEKAVHPRPHVGESLVSSTVRIFDEIGFLPTMEEAGFTRKYGAAWRPTKKEGEFSIRFAEFPQEGVNQDYTYHVERSKFDHLLLLHARDLGSKVVQGVEVREVLFDDNNAATGVRVSIDGASTELSSKFVIDCSGRNTILGNQLGLRQKDPVFNQFAVAAWFENVHRSDNPETEEYIHIYFLPTERGWAWQIPLTDEITSIGVVAEREVFKQSRQRKEEYFWDMVATSPALATAMENAKQVEDFNTEADYSYVMEKFVGNSWMLVGDSARFVDPIFSSGISIAAEAAKYASKSIVEALQTGDRSEAALQPYEDKIKAGVAIWYEFILLYYKLMHLFTYFIDHKEHRLQILQLLQGEVYERENAPVLDAMREMIKTVEETPGHLWAGHLTDIPID
ncbi:MAG: NAD(P)/FAD-dependent oxidoreductase [Acidimicrobiia bacterium]|nr:NAD(P)/FAD-dependent oxidoreductase [Acidimicrobiia bacterium]